MSTPLRAWRTVPGRLRQLRGGPARESGVLNNIIYIVGLIVVVLIVLSFLGLA